MSKKRTTGGRIMAAREAKGLSLRRAARRLGVSPRALRGWEGGRTDVPLAVRQAMAVLYGTAPQYLVPDRPTAVERDSASAVIRIGSVTFALHRSDDDTLRTFLAAVREERGVAPGAPLAVRETDAALLAETLGGSAEDIVRTLRRLLGVSEDEAVEFSRWIFSRTAVAGVLALGLTAGLAGTTAFAATPPAGSAGTAGSAGAAVSAQHRPDGNTDLGERRDPNWAEIGDAAVLRREDDPTDQAP
ncbi:MAG TPA: helix-turn-helix transcriptional regulator [Acidimicrobiia bacterium]|nr:helix-turn-helix transcriptional regulator [Acidimicrobiia bacterium]